MFIRNQQETNFLYETLKNHQFKQVKKSMKFVGKEINCEAIGIEIA
jgi:hypothetical protein